CAPPADDQCHEPPCELHQHRLWQYCKDNVLLRREPFFGQNAKPFVVQLSVVIACIAVLFPLYSGWMDRSVRPWFTAGFDRLCSIGLCTPEAAERTHGSKLQQ